MNEGSPEIEIIHSEGREICYLTSVNKICFGKIGNKGLDEDDIILLLNHEYWHWAQQLFLTYDETVAVHYKNYHLNYCDRFTEMTNPYYSQEILDKLNGEYNDEILH